MDKKNNPSKNIGVFEYYDQLHENAKNDPTEITPELKRIFLKIGKETGFDNLEEEEKEFLRNAAKNSPKIQLIVRKNQMVFRELKSRKKLAEDFLIKQRDTSESKITVGIEFENNIFNFHDQCKNLDELKELLDAALYEIGEPIMRIVFSNNGDSDTISNDHNDIVNLSIADESWNCSTEDVIQVANQAIAESRKSIVDQINKMQIIMN